MVKSEDQAKAVLWLPSLLHGAHNGVHRDFKKRPEVRGTSLMLHLGDRILGHSHLHCEFRDSKGCRVRPSLKEKRGSKSLVFSSALRQPRATSSVITCPQHGHGHLLLCCSAKWPLLYHSSTDGGAPARCCSNHSSVLCPAVPQCVPADHSQVHRPRAESKLSLPAHCWNTRKSEKAFHYSQQVSAPGHTDTSNKGMKGVSLASNFVISANVQIQMAAWEKACSFGACAPGGVMTVNSKTVTVIVSVFGELAAPIMFLSS